MSNSSRSVVAVVGASGVGKSKLAIDLAVQLNGECINADAMQIYSGLDISTNKVHPEERSKCPHHLLGIYDLIENNETYTVHNYQKDVLPLIDKILRRNHVPILVGGTMYYVEAVLFEHLVPERSGSADFKREEMTDKGNDELFAMLEQVDPQTAYALHPNDRRKIIRALEVYNRTGKQLSVYYSEQHGLPNETPSSTAPGSQRAMLSGRPRYENSLLIWLHCEQTVLDTRLNLRIDEMIKDGLIAELDDFLTRFKQLKAGDSNVQESIHSGVLQSIGLKEFMPYLLIDASQRDSDHGREVYQQCIETMKTRTRRYARKQLTWIRNRLLKRRDDGLCPPVFKLDVTGFVRAANEASNKMMADNWNDIVLKARAIMENTFCRGTSLEALKILESSAGISPERLSSDSINDDPVVRHQCKTCKGSPVFVRQSQWHQHITGWKHIKAQSALRRSKNSPSAKLADIIS